jgi:hypothetical protein
MKKSKYSENEILALKERLRKVINLVSGSDRGANRRFAETIGIQGKIVTEWASDKILKRFPNYEYLQRIKEVHRVRPEYIESGDGTMFEESINAENEKTEVPKEDKPLTEADFIRILTKSQEQIDHSQRQIDRFQDQIDSIIQLVKEQQGTIKVQQGTISELTHKITGKKEEKKRRRVIINCKEPAPHRCN